MELVEVNSDQIYVFGQAVHNFLLKFIPLHTVNGVWLIYGIYVALWYAKIAIFITRFHFLLQSNTFSSPLSIIYHIRSFILVKILIWLLFLIAKSEGIYPLFFGVIIYSRIC